MKGDFANSRIYRIVCNETGLNYYGSTTQTLSKRLGAHVCDYKRWRDGKQHFVTSFSVLEAGNYEIVLVEKLENITNREQLRAVERRYIEANECVNKCIPGRTMTEYNADHREQRAQWRADNPGYMAQHYQDNKEERATKVECPYCSSVVRKDGLGKHQKSAKCLTAQRILEH